MGTTVLAIVGKLFITTSFSMICVWTMEIFPTVVAVFSLGLCSLSAKAGSVLGPFVGQLVSNILTTVRASAKLI